MIERFIYSALTDGIADLTAEPKRLERVFDFFQGLDDAEVTNIRAYYAANPPSVIHNFPRETSPFPLFAIVLKDESEPTKFLGDFAGFDLGDDLEAYEGFESDGIDGAEVFGSIYQHTFHVMVFAKHPDVCVWYYHIAKYLLTRARHFFVECGLFDMELGGHDVAPDPRYVPAFLFVRTLRFSCQRQFEVVGSPPSEAEGGGRIRRVAGIHVAGGSNTISATVDGETVAVSGAKTLVTPYDPE